jgi:type I restriction enzyme, S subunit
VIELNDLPDGWIWSELSELAALINGDRGKNYPNRSALVEVGIPFINAGHLENGIIQMPEMNYISEERFNLLGSGKVKPKDILYCLRGSLGKIAIVKDIQRGAIASSLVIIRPFDYSDPEYLFYFLISPLGKSEITKYDNGSAQPNLSAGNVSTYSIPLPPLNEQRRIVSTIEQLTDRSNKARTALEDVPKLIEQFRQSVLAAAFRGDLTADWREKNPDIEPASELLERIKIDRRKRWEEAELEKMKAQGKEPKDDKWKGKYKEPELLVSSLLPNLPNSWSWLPVEMISTKVVDGVHQKPNYIEKGIPFVTVKNLTAGEGISFDNLNYISLEDHTEFIKRANPEKGDVLISKDGTLGVIRLVRTDKIFSIFVSVALVKPVNYAMSEYLELAFSAPQMQKQMLGTGSGLQHIHLQDLRKYAVPVAPLREQKEIIKRVRQKLAVIDSLVSGYKDTFDYFNQLDRSILAKAFRGELVPQDPNDEPAAVLLERIRAEREQTSTPKQRGKTTRKNSSKQLSINLE